MIDSVEKRAGLKITVGLELTLIDCERTNGLTEQFVWLGG